MRVKKKCDTQGIRPRVRWDVEQVEEVRLVLCGCTLDHLQEMAVRRVRSADKTLTSRAQRMVFFVSGDIPRLLRNSAATHSESKSCLSWPVWKQSARSPIRPKHNRTVDSDLSSSARQRWIRSRMVDECGKRSPTCTVLSLDALGTTRPRNTHLGLCSWNQLQCPYRLPRCPHEVERRNQRDRSRACGH